MFNQGNSPTLINSCFVGPKNAQLPEITLSGQEVFLQSQEGSSFSGERLDLMMTGFDAECPKLEMFVQ